MCTLIGSIEPEHQYVTFGGKALSQILLGNQRIDVGVHFNRFTDHYVFQFVHIYSIGIFSSKVERLSNFF
jgi:hypothetical protein